MEVEKELANLQQQDQDLTISLRTTPDLRQKRKIEEQRNVIRSRIRELETKIQDVKEKEALEQLNKMLTENRYLLFLSVNGVKIEIPTDLKPEITFQPCKHKQKIFIAEILRNPSYPSNVNLLQTWQRLLSEDSTITTMRLCPECQKEKQSKLVQWGLKTEKPNGRATLVLRRLQ
jgi:hypothetical protein